MSFKNIKTETSLVQRAEKYNQISTLILITGPKPVANSLIK